MDALVNSTLPMVGKPITMSSREIAELTGKGHRNVKRDIEKMLTELSEDALKFEHIYLDSMNREQTEYLLDRDLTENLLMGYSPILRRKVLQRIREMESVLSQRIPTTAEAFAHAFTMLADNERRLEETDGKLVALDARVEKLADAQLLKAKTQDMETITDIRKRLNKRYGLPERIINDVVRQMPYSPRPCGMVRNTHEGAEGSSFAVYWIKDISKCFARFVGECRMVSAMKATHPDIDGKFQLVKGGAA